MLMCYLHYLAANLLWFSYTFPRYENQCSIPPFLTETTYRGEEAIIGGELTISDIYSKRGNCTHTSLANYYYFVTVRSVNTYYNYVFILVLHQVT